MASKVLLSDKLAPEGIEILSRTPGIEVDSRPGLDAAELISTIGGYEGLIIRSGTTVTRDVVAAADRLRVIGRAGIGVDNIDIDAASKRGIVVMNTPGGNNVTTAEHTISMMLSMARHIPQANASLRAGQWRRGDFLGTEVANKTLGIIGTGNIGSIVAALAKGLHMNIVAYDPYITEQAAARLGVELVDLDQLYARADFISVHTPLTPDTRGLIAGEAFEKMKPGVRVLNCARGGIIDEQALLAALESGKVAGAAMDVFCDEPPGGDHPLVSHPRVVATPHLGASTGEAQLNVAIAVAEQVRDFLLDGTIRNALNVASVSSELAGVVGPYMDLAGKIGRLYAQYAKSLPGEVKIEYRGQIAEADCRPVTAAVLEGLLAPVMDTPVNRVNAPFLAKDRGVTVVEQRRSDAKGYANSLLVSFEGSSGTTVIEGAVFGSGVIRLVRFDDFHLEAIPVGHIIVVQNHDIPGVVGRVGTFLGKERINIAGLELGRVHGDAISFVHVDTPLDETQLKAFRTLEGITRADMVDLG